MKINYWIKEEYKQKLKEISELNGQTENLISEPDANLIFENKSVTTKVYEIKPEIIFWWIDDVSGKFADKELENYGDDIMGGGYWLHWKNNKLSVTRFKSGDTIFQVEATRSEIYNEFRSLSLRIHDEMESINPIVIKSHEWAEYKKVNEMADNL